MSYLEFNILITELDGGAVFKTTQTYETQMKTFKVREPKWKHAWPKVDLSQIIIIKLSLISIAIDSGQQYCAVSN